MPAPDQTLPGDLPPEQTTPPAPDQGLPEAPAVFQATDLRTGTEVDPAVVAHHAAFLQGEPYSNPYGSSPEPEAVLPEATKGTQ
jgi:hypothetical protein